MVDPNSYVLVRPTASQLAAANNLGGGGGSSYTFSTPLVNNAGTVSANNAAADGSTKGVATFTAADFNSSGGLISIDYTNGQAASGSTKGFLTSTDWTTFNSKQAGSANLTTFAAIAPSANVQSLLGAADYSAMRSQLGLAIGTNVQAYDADLTTYAGITPSANVQSLLGAADYSAMRTQLGLVIGTNVQAYDADLTTYASITPSANVQTLLGAANFAAFKTSLSLNNVENTALSTWAGSSNITTLGTIATGTWNGSIIGPTYLGTGTSISTKYLRGDGTWQTISGGGDALTSGNLSQFASTTSAQLFGVLSDETGSGTGALAVFNINPLILRPDAAQAADEVDITKENGTKTYSSNVTWTRSATPVDGQKYGVRVTNSGSAPITVTLWGTVFSEPRNANLTSNQFTIPVGTYQINFERHGTTDVLVTDPITIVDLTTVSPATGDYLPLYDVSGAVEGKATIGNILALGGSVTSVAATVPSWLSVSGSPITTSGTLAITFNGTKGDIIVGTNSTTAAKLPVGTNGQVLTANSSAANGVEWAAAAGGSPWANVSVTGNDIDWSLGTSFYKTLSANVDITSSNTVAGKPITVALTNGGTYTATFNSVVWPGGAAPTVTATANKTDLFRIEKINGTLFGSVIGQNYTVPTGGGTTPVLLSHRGDNFGFSGGTSGTIDTTGANFIVVAVGFYNAGTPAVSDSKGNTWTALTGTTSTTVGSRLFYCYNPTVGTGHTFTVSGSSTYSSLAVQAWSNVLTSPFDVQNGAAASGAWTSLSTGSVTPSQANSLLIATVAFETGAGTISIGSGFTISDTVAYASGAGEGVSLAYKILTASTATNPAWASTTSSSDGAARIAAFKY